MIQLAIFPIVEGHGEVTAVPLLLRRIWKDVLGQTRPLHVLQPYRLPKGKMVAGDSSGLERALGLARLKLRQAQSRELLVLVMLDADKLCKKRTYPEGLGPKVLERCRTIAKDLTIAVSVADHEYESWLIAGSNDLDAAERAEATLGKGWMKQEFGRWSETVDMAQMTSEFEIQQARTLSASFDKLCRNIARSAS
jgi:hypothetical protein